MPVIVEHDLPAIETLEKEGLFVMCPKRSKTQDIRPLKIALVNLMPTKTTTEIQFMRLLSNSPLQIKLTLLHMGSHKSTHTSEQYLQQFYKTLNGVKHMKFDGMIITGAPVEDIEFEQVDYWKELTQLFDYTKRNVFSTLFVCWGALAGAYYLYDVPKINLPKKFFGVFPFQVNPENDLLLKGVNDQIYVPQSRHSTWDENILCKKLKPLLYANEFGCCLALAHQGRQIFSLGHFEYDRETLATEYFRDIKKGLPIEIPRNYFPNDNPEKMPVIRWRSEANLLFSNWLNYIIYQQTPFDLNGLSPL